MHITPNQLTLARIAAVPFIALLISVDGKIAVIFALVAFVAAALTDWFDGYLARRDNAVSVVGRVFDPIADKLLVLSCLLALAYNGRLSTGLIVPALAITMREIFVSGLREYMAQLMNERMADEDISQNQILANPALLASSPLAKVKNAVQLVAIGCLIPAPYLIPPFTGIIGAALLWCAAGLAVFTGYQYWQIARPHLRQHF